MSGLQELPESLHKAAVGGVVLYFALVIYAAVAGDALAFLVSELLFGLIAFGVGVVLINAHRGERSPLFAAGVALTVGGLAQFGWVLTRDGSFDLLATGGVVAGVAFYFYSVYVE
ncbi:hypothetical protein ACYJ1Y_06995 [Natrialbaceae archaeon A-gly3]